MKDFPDMPLARRRMIQEQLIPRGIEDQRVLAAMARVPRHLFVPEALWHQAYSDCPLPIGHGQTISQPYIVALMTEALALKGKEKVLEIGTGSGYQAAVLAELAQRVFSVERVPELALKARRTLDKLGYGNVLIRVGDGTQGWPERAPFDAIIVTAGAPQVPKALLEQLKEGGRMVIPVGGEEGQELLMIVKAEGRYLKEDLGGCRFVKLIGEHGWRAEFPSR